jgi:hypothetical protein
VSAPRRSRYWLASVLAGLVVVGGAGVLALGPALSSLAAKAAARRGYELRSGHARPIWFGVRLTDVVVASRGPAALEAHIGDAEFLFGATLGLDCVRLRHVTATLTGTPSELADRLEGRASTSETVRKTKPVSVDMEDVSVAWRTAEGVPPSLEVRGLTAHRTSVESRFAADEIRARHSPFELVVSGSQAQVDAEGALRQAQAASLVVEWSRSAPSEAERTEVVPAKAGAGDSDATATRLWRADLPSLRTIADRAARTLAGRMPQGVEFAIENVVWKAISPDGQPLTIGPGRISLARKQSSIELEFAEGASPAAPTSAALSGHLKLPADGGDLTLDLVGGAASLATLGLKDGPFGLFDVAHATVAGRTRLVLSADATALDFDGSWTVRALSLQSARLAAEAVRGLDAQVRARGSMNATGTLRFDDLSAVVGALRVEASGTLDQAPDHTSAVFHVEIPPVSCQTLLESIPVALVPLAQGMTFTGTLGAHGHVSLDTRWMDDLQLDYDVADGCRAVRVPAVLDRAAFGRPFMHRIYLPDGSVRDEETGPGTPDWTPLDRSSPFLEVAVTTTEDGAFRRHHGFNKAALRAALIADLKTHRFMRGASTITMQLAKNLFLSREKTLSRKLEEAILADYIEQTFSKDEILELYFNVVEFGPAVYGVGPAAEYYFGRSPVELNLAESFFLTSILPAPLRYSNMRDAGEVPDSWLRNLRSLMRVAHQRGLLTEDELNVGLQERVQFWRSPDRPPPRTPIAARPRRDFSRQDAEPETDPPTEPPDP